jgi:hypothetical protein
MAMPQQAGCHLLTSRVNNTIITSSETSLDVDIRYHIDDIIYRDLFYLG